MPNSSKQRLRRLLLANSLGLLLGVAVFSGLEWDDSRWVGSLVPQALSVSEPYLRQTRTEAQQTDVRTWLILYHDLNAPCSAFSAAGLRCGEASPSVRDAAVCIQFNRWRHLEWVMTETATIPLTVESAKCQRRDLGPYLWTELLPFPYYAPPIGCRFAWAAGCLVPDPDHPAPVTPMVPTPIPRQPPPPRETGEDDEAYAVRVARQELVRAVGPTAIARGHVEVDEQEEGWLVVVRDANAVCGEDPAEAGGCQFRTGPDRLRDVYVCVLRDTWATPVEGMTDRGQPYAVTGRECRPGLF